MLLVLTAPDDVTADVVIAKLRRRGAQVHRFDPADYPSRASLSLAFGAPGRRSATLHTSAGRIDLQQLQALWLRRPGLPVADARVQDPRWRRYIAAESAAHLDDVWNTLHCVCFPAAPLVIARAEMKASQLAAADELGLEIPPTLLTTQPADFFDFHRQQAGRVVSKLAGPAFNRHFGPEIGRYSELVSPRDVGYADAVRWVPSIFQAYVDKQLELRITVVGKRVLCDA